MLDRILEWVAWLLGSSFSLVEQNSMFFINVGAVLGVILAGYLLYRLAILSWRALGWCMLRLSDVLYLTEHRTAGLLGKIMARIKKHIVADIIFDALFEAYCKDELTRSEWKRYNNLVGKFCGLDDLVIKKIHKNAIKNALKSKPKLAGPKQKMAAGGPPSLHIPSVEDVQSNVIPTIKFLQKLKERNAA